MSDEYQKNIKFALSIKQPWAQLIIENKKSIEIRTWNTDYRGELFIHTGKKVDKIGMEMFDYDLKELTFGAIIGKCNFKTVIKYNELEDFSKDKKCHLNKVKWFEAPLYGFKFKDCEKISPISLKGQLKIFSFNYQISIENKVIVQKQRDYTLLDFLK